MSVLTTFPNGGEFRRAMTRLEALSLPFEAISSDPGFRRVGVPAVAMGTETQAALCREGGEAFVCSGWVQYWPANIAVPSEVPPRFDEDVFGEAAIMVLAPCVADETKIRLIAHVSGDLTDVFPYLNAEMHNASYNRNGPTFTFMDSYRMISLYPRRVTIAKADEIVDAWRVLEMIRCRANGVWSRRAEIEPCYEMRERPPALEIFKRLPRINCRACGEPTCLAFAVRVHSGEVSATECGPVFGGEYAHLKDPLVEICRGLGVSQ